MIVFIDSSILGSICNPNYSQEAIDIQNWMFKLLSRSVRLVSSDICDYEIRRNLLLEQEKNPNINGIEKLDESSEYIEFLPVTREILLQSARFWADARKHGQPTADDRSLDADVIICATWQLLTNAEPGRYIVIATTNIKHLSRFAEAQRWQDIRN